MEDTLIVIATNNGGNFLGRLLKSINASADERNYTANVLVVDTGSSDEMFLQYLDILEDMPNYRHINLKIDRLSGGYCTGAYIHAFKNHPSQFYMFMHDSMEVKMIDWLEHFIDPLREKEDGCVAFLTFGQWYDNESQRVYVNSIFNEYQAPVGIFGPIFSTSRKMLEMFDKNGWLNKVPTEKMEQCAMERGWAVGFHSMGTPVRSINHGYDTGKIDNDEYELLTKYLVHRQ